MGGRSDPISARQCRPTSGQVGEGRTSQVVKHPGDILDVGGEADLDVVHLVLLARLVLDHCPSSAPPETIDSQGGERTIDNDVDGRFSVIRRPPKATRRFSLRVASHESLGEKETTRTEEGHAGW